MGAVICHFCQMKIIQTRTFLALKYGMCRQTISRMLKEHCGITHNSALTPMDLELFITKVGTPEQFRKAQDALKG